jgi:exonuclease III
MSKALAKHVGRVEKVDGRIIAAHMYFKKCKLYIIQIYLPSNKKESNQYQKTLRQMITTEMKKKTKIILMGDFNAASNPGQDRPYRSKLSNNWRPEAEIFNFLNDWAFTDIQQVWELDLPSPTWIGKISHSRIDYIWVTPDIALNNVHSFANEKADNIVNSDHTLLQLKIFTKGITEPEPIGTIPQRKKGKSTIIAYQETSTEQWRKFANKIEKKIEELKLDNAITELA